MENTREKKKKRKQDEGGEGKGMGEVEGRKKEVDDALLVTARPLAQRPTPAQQWGGDRR